MSSTLLQVEADKQRAQYDADGALLVPGLLDPADYQCVLDDLQTRIQLISKRENLSLPAEQENRVRWLSDCLQVMCQHDGRLQGVLYDAMSRSTSLHHMSSHSKIVQVVSNLMGPRFEVHLYSSSTF